MDPQTGRDDDGSSLEMRLRHQEISVSVEKSHPGFWAIARRTVCCSDLMGVSFWARGDAPFADTDATEAYVSASVVGLYAQGCGETSLDG